MYSLSLANHRYRKLSIKGATSYKGAPSFMTPNFMGFWTFLVISQPKMVRFSFCKKPLEDENAPYLMGRTLRACLLARRLYWGFSSIRSIKSLFLQRRRLVFDSVDTSLEVLLLWSQVIVSTYQTA